MPSFARRTTRLPFAVCALLASTACGGEADREGTEAPAVTHSDGLVEIASLKLSDTHEIHFYEDTEGGMGLAHERLNVDLDVADAHVRLGDLGDSDSLAEMYAALAGPLAQADVRDTLVQADLRIQEAARLLPDVHAADGEMVPGAELRADELAARPGGLDEASGEPIISTRQTACTEPPWNWAADEAWFKSFSACDSSFQYCDSLDPHHVHPGKAKTAQATAFAQSHCSGARFLLSWSWSGWCGGIIPYPCSKGGNFAVWQLPPRALDTAIGTGSSRSWKGEITSHAGRFTGMAMRRLN